MAKKNPLCRQSVPVKRGDIVRILADKRNDDSMWLHIAVVTTIDYSIENGGLPYGMIVIDSDYEELLWPVAYERIGNAMEAVLLIQAAMGMEEVFKSVKM